MPPLEWIVPIVVITLWVIGHFLKDRDNEQARRAKTEDRSPTTDIDKFLQEIERLRKESRDQGDEIEPAPKPVVKRVKPKPPLPAPRVRAVTRATSAADVLPVVVEAVPAAKPAAKTAASAPAPGTLIPRAPILPAALTLLKQPQTIATAFILHEIFEGPRFRRRIR